MLDAGDSFWDTYYPPNGWNCRCSVQQRSDRDMARLKLEPAPRAPETPPVRKRVNTPEGLRIVEVPQGIDPGWAYNVGQSGWAAE